MTPLPINPSAHPSRRLRRVLAVSALALLCAGPLRAGTPAFPQSLKKEIKHVIIIFQENRSFDAYYGEFPGANGLANATASATTQTDQFGASLASLPQSILNGAFNVNGAVPPAIPSSGPDPRFPSSLPNGPFSVQNYVAKDHYTGDMIHSFYTEQYQINDPANPTIGNDPKNQGGSLMSKFSWWSTNPGLVMGHYDVDNDPEGVLAAEFVLCDNFFHDAFGGSFLNHQWLIAARSPIWPASAGVPSASIVTQFDANGFPQQQAPKSNTNVYGTVVSQAVSDKALTNDPKLPGFPLSNSNQSLGAGDYWAVNTILPIMGPRGGFTTADESPTGPTSQTASSASLPLQTHDTIGDRLLAAGETWKWYAGGWNEAKAGLAGQRFQFHHQPFAYFQKYALAQAPVPQTPAAAGSPNPYVPAVAAVPGVDSPGSAAHLKDIDADFFQDLAEANLPDVTFIKAYGADNGHNAYSNLASGDNFVADVVNRIRTTPEIWKNCVIFVTNDEHGGIWDHVTPPRRDGWGPGSRVPLLVISPHVKSGFIDHTQYTNSSLLAFIEGLYGLPPLNASDAEAVVPLSPFRGQPDLFIYGDRGQPLAYRLPAYNDPTDYKVTDGSLRANGLRVNSQTGLLKGTPTRRGSIDFKVRITGNPTLHYNARIVVR